MNDLETKLVPFMGTELMAAKDNDGQVWAAIRWMCDGIGLNKNQADRQLKNIQDDAVLSKGASNLTLPTSGGAQVVHCLHLDYVPLWLAKISITPTMERETPEVAQRLIQYQLKAKDVLAAAFLPNSVAESGVDLSKRARMLEAENRQRSITLRERNAVDKRLAMYLKAKGADKLLMLSTLRQDGFDSETVDYVESAIRSEIEEKATSANKRRSTTPNPKIVADYQTALNYFLTHGTEIGSPKNIRGQDCICVYPQSVRAILNSHGIYDRDFLKWAREHSHILTDVKGFTRSARLEGHSTSKKYVCFVTKGDVVS